MGGKFCLGSRRPEGRTDDFAGGDLEVGNQTQGPVPVVFELDTLDQTRPSRFAGVYTLERLHAGFLIDAHNVRAFGGKLRYISVSIAKSFDIGLVLSGCFALVLRGEPVLAFVRSQIRIAKKRSTCRGEMLSTMPLLAASRVNSPSVQCDTGSTLSAGGWHANAIIPATCSALNRGGAPLRVASVNTPMTSFSRS